MNYFKKLSFYTSVLFVAIFSIIILPKVSLADYIPGAFVTTWDTTKGGVLGDKTITINAQSGTTNYNVSWGDGNNNTGVITSTITHTYPSEGIYIVSITGDFPGLLSDATDTPTVNSKKLISIDQWGSITWSSMNSAFRGAENMIMTATDIPNVSGVFDMSYAFYGATKFNGYISLWNVEQVRPMSFMFYGATSFNNGDSLGASTKPLNWNTLNLMFTDHMFYGATSFNQPIGSWNTSGVQKMDYMFSGATSFNQPIGNWNVSKVFDMSHMFNGAISFNQDISGWGVSSVTDMSYMFYGATSFNQPIGGWGENFNKVYNTSYMFYNATSFDQDISDWNIGTTRNMKNMFNTSQCLTLTMTQSLLNGLQKEPIPLTKILIRETVFTHKQEQKEGLCW